MERPQHEPLKPAVRWLVATFAGATTGSAFASLFVNLFIFVVTRQLTQLAIFSAAYFFSLTFVFYGAAYLFRQASPLAPYRWGLVLSAGFYGSLVLLANHAAHVLVWLGLYQGIGQGFFWFGANLMTFDTVPADQRIRFYGINSAVGSIVGVAGPLAGGLVVSAVPGIRGYLLVFLISLGIYALTFAMSLKVPPGPPLGHSPARLSLDLPRTVPLWKSAFQTLMVRGTREATAGLAGVYLVYLATRNAWAVGVYGAVSAVARMLGAVGVARQVTPGRRVRAMAAGVAGMTLAAAVLLVGRGWPFVFGYGLLTAFAMPWFTIPNEAIPLDVMDRDPRVAERRVAYMLSREIGLNVGRLAGLGALLAAEAGLPPTTALIALLMLTSGAQSWVTATGRRIWGTLALAGDRR
ncbi:MAG: MFS transporter [Thermaerobacter sp.]|nr:MFS transporter [Thermaerobacter sp.]